MYDGKAGVEVYVKPNHTNTAYREYEAPRSSPLYTGYGNERYIEAVSGERFAVFVKLDQSFDFKNYTQARVSIAIDGASIGCEDFLAKPKARQEVIKVFENSLTCCDGRWECVGFQFQELRARTYSSSNFVNFQIC